MRLILPIALLLMLAGFVSCSIDGRSADGISAATKLDWIRTIDGWERAHDWQPSLVGPPVIHPLIVAACQVLVSLFALVAAADWPTQQLRAQQRPMRWFDRSSIPATSPATSHQKQLQ